MIRRSFPVRPSLAVRFCIVLILPLLLWASAAAAAEFTPAQRTEIVGIVREALKQDPSILRDAIAALQADEGAQAHAATRAAIADAGARLVRPEDPVAGNPKGDVTIV